MAVFISYSRHDRDFTLRLVENLQRCGYKTWIDVQDIPSGAAWPDEIDKGLESAEAVVGVLSENSMASGNVKNEWDWALEYKKPFIPVRLRPCEISHRYIRISFIDCSSDESTGLARLCEVLKDAQTTYRETSADEVRTGESASVGVDDRAKMLQKVYDFWIKGVLEPAQIDHTWLELPAEQRPEAVQPEIQRELHNPDFDAFSLGHGAPIADVFYRLGRELLILGAPGSGKTMTLLELAHALILRAQASSTLPIPVVFNLTSWGEKHPEKLEAWLIEHLFLEYGVSRKLAELWIEDGKLTYFLDGLDEVPSQYRDACVTAINSFWRQNDQIDNGIVVCSRIADYEPLTTRLHLDNAILLNPLTLAQADAYLSQLGAAWSELRTAIAEDAVLHEFVKSPLLLNVMAVAYQATPRNQISGLSEPNQKRQLFERYVVRRLRDSAAPGEYTNAKTRHYLHWLAKQMVAHEQIIFQIEGLQPDWLRTEHQRQQYRRGIRLGAWLFAALVGAVFFVSVGTLFFKLFFRLFFPVVITFVGGLVGGQNIDRIRQVERLNWSSKNAKKSLLFGLFFGLLFGIVGMFFFGSFFGQFLGASIGLVGGLIGGLNSTSIEQRTRPNQGVWYSLNNALFIGLVGGLVFGLGVGLFAGLVGGPVAGIITGLIIGVIGSLIIEISFGLYYGGNSVIRHTILRLLLYRAGDAPLDYARFLDYCSARHLIRRVGGGYIFRHRMLMEYFAEREI
jgi:hypothetical protein